MPHPPRFVCTSDEHLINAAFASRIDVEAAADLLRRHRFVIDETDDFPDAAILHRGSAAFVVDWLEHAVDASGHMHAWPRGAGPGRSMAAPETWEKISVDRSEWDAESRVLEKLLGPSVAELEDTPAQRRLDELLENVDLVHYFDDRAFDNEIIAFAGRRKWASRLEPGFPMICPSSSKATYNVVAFTLDIGVTISCCYPTVIPADRRMAVLERVWVRNAESNALRDAGRFILDVKTGILRLTREWKVDPHDPEPDVSDAEMSAQFGRAVQECDAFHDAVMRVAFGVTGRLWE